MKAIKLGELVRSGDHADRHLSAAIANCKDPIAVKHIEAARAEVSAIKARLNIARAAAQASEAAINIPAYVAGTTAHHEARA